jgi:hypothetical protein
MHLSHNDDPTLNDGFHNENFIKEVSELIRNCEPPKGIGINGYWGTGKTSALLQIYHQLTDTNPYGNEQMKKALSDSTIIPVWFEAWRYQHEQLPIVALLHEVRQQMALWGKLKEEAAKITSVTIRGILSAFDETMKIISGGVIKPELGKLQTIGETYEKEHYQQPLSGQAIRKLLQEAIKEVLPDATSKLVIFIDDLDRCEPETALRLMEGIKVYLNLNNCVVIFGMDQRQVERALTKALSLPAENAKHYAREYLEKICQDIIHLPLADKMQKSEYLNGLLHALFEEGKTPSRVTSIRAITDNYDCLPANPRKIKALANHLAGLLRKIPESESDEFFLAVTHERLKRDAALCCLVAMLYCFHREVYEQLYQNPAYIGKLREWAKSSEDLESLRKNRDYKPMEYIVPAREADHDVPVNPSDSNVFRSHQMLQDLEQITDVELNPFLFP